METWIVRNYVTPTGKIPFQKWLNGLKDRKARAVIRERLNRLRLGNLGDCKSVGEGVLELRIHYGPGYRVYFAVAGKAIVVLLCGGAKQSQDSDIKKAEKYWKELWEREDE